MVTSYYGQVEPQKYTSCQVWRRPLLEQEIHPHLSTPANCPMPIKLLIAQGHDSEVHQIICTEDNIISLGSDGIRVGLREGLMLNKITCVCPAASQHPTHTRSKDLNSPCSMDLSAHMANCVVAVGGPELYTVNLSYSQVFYATRSTYTLPSRLPSVTNVPVIRGVRPLIRRSLSPRCPSMPSACAARPGSTAWGPSLAAYVNSCPIHSV